MNDEAQKFKRPRTCNGCRAENNRIGERKCRLGFETKVTAYSPTWKLPIYGPAEPCPKPKTIREYISSKHKGHHS